ncbi:MAG: hypothetical protein HYY13_06720, partial [Nitrospirae bacterium]|nr:hypothetical protein [Nitrospirota bacterium]
MALSSCGSPKPGSPDLDAFELSHWSDPPKEFRPQFWWHWPGGKVSEEGMERDLALFDRIGIGGAYIQAIGPSLGQNDPEMMTVGTPAYFEKVRTACRIAEKRGMKINVYFGTSWETGSPHPGDGKER